jgi:hypothetical protein
MVQKRQVFVVMEASGIKGIFETREGAVSFIKEGYNDPPQRWSKEAAKEYKNRELVDWFYSEVCGCPLNVFAYTLL